MKKFTAFALALVLVASMLFGCGASNESGGAVADKGYGEIFQDGQLGSTGGTLADQTTSSSTATNTSQKLVRKMWLSVETEDLDTLLTGIDQRINELGGYVESREVYNGSQRSSSRYRNAELTIRIPADKLSIFVDHVTENTNIISSNETAEDITLTYTATENQVKALETEHVRLLELLEKADSMSDVLEIEKRLTQVRTDLENVTSQLRLYENQVTYGTVYLSVSEVKEYTDTTEPETVWQRIGKGFMENLKDIGDFFVELFVVVVAGLPYISLIVVLLVVTVFVIKSRKKKKNAAQQQNN